MIKEKSAGVIVFRFHPREGLQFLLLCHHGDYWNFSKGHVERGERDDQAALRELREETGLRDIRLAKNWRQGTSFFFKEKRGEKFELIKKEVIFFLAKVSVGALIRILADKSTGEIINGYAWLDFKIARKYLKFKNLQAILDEANSFILDKVDKFQKMRQKEGSQFNN